MTGDMVPAQKALDGEILLPGEPDQSDQEDTLDVGCERFTLGVFEHYVTAELLALMERLGDERFYGGFKNNVFEMHSDYPDDPDCSCGHDQEEFVWEETHPHASTCPVFLDDAAVEGMSNEEETQLAQLDDPICNCGVDQQFVEWQRQHPHAPDCRKTLPNFRCGDIEFDWYKHIGRRMRVNRPVTNRELQAMFDKCRASL